MCCSFISIFFKVKVLETAVCYIFGCLRPNGHKADRAHVGMGHTLCRRDDEEDSVVLAPYDDKAIVLSP